MRLLRFLAFLLLTAGTAFGATTAVQVKSYEFTGTAPAAGQHVQLSPVSTVAPAPSSANLEGFTDSDGQITFENLPGGTYTLSMIRSGVPSLTLRVPLTDGGTNQASAIVISNFRFPAPTSILKPDVFRGVPYLFPPTNGLEGQVLYDIDGSGALGWKTPYAAGPGFGDLVWTNDNNRIRPIGYPATVQVWPTNLGVVDFGPGIIIGANSSNIFENGFGGNQKDFSFISFRDVEAGDHNRNFLAIAAGQDSGGLRYGYAALYTDTNISYLSANTFGGSLNQTFEAGNTPSLGNRITLTTNNNTAFNVDGAGGISVMKGVAQNWPSSQGASGTVLTNNGSGVLGWSRFLSATNLTIFGVTNQLIFGATNIAPVSAVAPSKWISVQVSGESTVYRLPLYE